MSVLLVPTVDIGCSAFSLLVPQPGAVPVRREGITTITTGVAGVVDRPVILGDVIHERSRIGGHAYEGTWTVVQHVRPTRVVLRGQGGPVASSPPNSSNSAAQC